MIPIKTYRFHSPTELKESTQIEAVKKTLASIKKEVLAKKDDAIIQFT